MVVWTDVLDGNFEENKLFDTFKWSQMKKW